MMRRMQRSPFSVRTRLLLPLAPLLAALLLPAVASAALQVEIDNEKSGHGDAYVTVVGAGFDVEGEDAEGHAIQNDVPAPVGEGLTLMINKLIAGRIYISYGAGVTEGVTFDSPTRFDWAELTVTPAEGDVANLTAVDQFAIGMRLDTYGPSGEHLEWLGDANSETIFQALHEIPGGPQATIESGGETVRVVSPKLYPGYYPDLGEYVRSMSGKKITLHTPFFNEEVRTTSEYSGRFAADGSITLSGWLDSDNPSAPAGQAPPSFTIPGSELIDEIYPAAHTPNDLEGAMRRDLFAGFSIGLWGGRYGNDAISFCPTPATNPELKGSWCPHFSQSAFGDARTELSPYPTCEQYAAVINQYADAYGNPYSDTSKEVTVGLDPAKVKTLKLTVLPDSGNAQPKASGNPNCGAGPPASPAATKAASTTTAAATALRARVGFHLLRRARVKRRKVKVGAVACPAGCGRIKALARRGRTVVARGIVKRSGPKRPLVLRLTRFGRWAAARHKRLKVRLDVWVTPPGQATRHARRPLFLIRHHSRR
jgi:hypothetical protein